MPSVQEWPPVQAFPGARILCLLDMDLIDEMIVDVTHRFLAPALRIAVIAAWSFANTKLVGISWG